MKIERTEWGIVHVEDEVVLFIDGSLAKEELLKAFSRRMKPNAAKLFGWHSVWLRLERQGYRCVRVTLTAEVEG